MTRFDGYPEYRDEWLRWDLFFSDGAEEVNEQFLEYVKKNPECAHKPMRQWLRAHGHLDIPEPDPPWGAIQEAREVQAARFAKDTNTWSNLLLSLSFTLQHTSQHTVAQAYTPEPHNFPPHRISRCMLPPHCTQPQNTCFYFLYSSFTTLQTPANTSEHTDWVKAIVLPYLGCPPN